MQLTLSVLGMVLLGYQNAWCVALPQNPAASILSAALETMRAAPNNPAASILSEALATAQPHTSTTTAKPAPKSTPAPTPHTVPFSEPVAAQKLCDYSMVGVNQEGGGSKRRSTTPATEDPPAEGGTAGAQSPLSNYIFYFEITDAGFDDIRYSRSLNWDSHYAFSVGRADYGGTHNMWVAAGSWSGLDYTWSSCGISFDGGKRVKGKGGKHPDIDTNIVSTITTKCTVTHEC